MLALGAVMAVVLATGYYFGPIALCFAAGVGWLIGAQFMEMNDRIGCAVLFIVSFFLGFALCLMWVMTKVFGV